ncbi:MAG: glycoside hydrolase family 2 [Chloroflexota bacterium]|nr:glycoside hydrolase family 2 [Chloroflexota bacterium]
MATKLADAPPIEHLRNVIPRSVARGAPPLLLDGEWRFEIDPGDRGLAEGWYLRHDWAATASWPGSVESHLARAEEAESTTRPWNESVVVWYERDFVLPEECCESADRLPLLTFGACGYETRVWLNGHLLRTVDEEEAHLGRWTSFAYELPAALLLPVNRLTVRVADSLDPETPRGKQESRVYKRGGIWYRTHTGPVGSVWVETVERNRLSTRIGVLSTIEDRLVELDLATRIRDAGWYALRLQITTHETGDALTERLYPLELPAGNNRQKVALELPEARLWSPSEPHLYHLSAELTDPQGRTSTVVTHFGLRKIEARGRRVYLNNEPLYLDGVLYQPHTATLEQMRRHFLAMKRLGCNLVRIHIAGIDPRIYDLADELGMLLWVEVPSPHTSTRTSRENHWAELQRMLVHIGLHPSVVVWSLYNEDWGAEDIATSAETRAYIASAYEYMRAHHPQVLVVDNDGWHHVSTGGRLESHLLTAHVYTPDLERWRQTLDGLVAGALDGVTAEPLVVGDPFFYAGQVPLLVSEWGGFGWPGYGGPRETSEKAERIRAFKRELRARRIAGDVYTQATSIEDEVNGLIDFESGKVRVPDQVLSSEPQGTVVLAVPADAQVEGEETHVHAST